MHAHTVESRQTHGSISVAADAELGSFASGLCETAPSVTA